MGSLGRTVGEKNSEKNKEKPSSEHFQASLFDEKLVAFRELNQPYVALKNHVDEIETMGMMSGKSSQIKAVFDTIKKMAKTTCNVLLMGETGTGKEMVAVAIHENSNRKEKRFVAVNCSAIPAALLESELFGHKKGAFTGALEARRGLFEEANGGTIFLDEIGDMPMDLQAKLLRVVQERKVTPVGENRAKMIDVRIIAATHKDLNQMVSEDLFREDLFYRLSVVPVRLPPLRERKEDIALLANHFLKKYCELNETPSKQFTLEALECLTEQQWPGNVRELQNSVERAVALSESNQISKKEIAESQVPASVMAGVEVFSKLMTLEQLEKRYILFVLAHTKDEIGKAAKILGINRKTLYRKRSLYGFVEEGDASDDSTSSHP